MEGAVAAQASYGGQEDRRGEEGVGGMLCMFGVGCSDLLLLSHPQYRFSYSCIMPSDPQ